MSSPLLASLRGTTRLLAAQPQVKIELVEDWSEPASKPMQQNLRNRPPVTNSPELQRILALPRRPPIDTRRGSTEADPIIELMQRKLGRDNPNCSCAANGWACIKRLNAAQAVALHEASVVGGLVGQICAGGGKTALDILLACVVPNVRIAVLLIPPNLQGQLERDWRVWDAHFRVPSLVIGKHALIRAGRPQVHVVPYSMFSGHKSTDMLTQMKPDLVIADEGHSLKNRNSARTARVIRHFKMYPETKFCFYTGTITQKSVRDYAHTSAFALRQGSPLPLLAGVTDEWATALDASEYPADPGALRLLGPGPVQEAFQSRLLQTQGVIATQEGAISATLVLNERKPPLMPATLDGLLKALRNSWTRPDGEEFIDILEVATCARQLASGFYYKYFYPRGEPEALIREWFDIRKAWNRELRAKLAPRSEFMDSALLCEHAAQRAYQQPAYKGPLPVWRAEVYNEWCRIENEVKPETRAVWVDEYLALDAAKWATENLGVVWWEFVAFGQRVAKLSGLTYHGGGPDAEKNILADKGDRTIICSIKSHGTGRDCLQHRYNKALVANPPSSGVAWEQMIARLYRLGQKEDEVHHWVYRHTPEMRDAVDTAILQARYAHNTTKANQSLLSANYTFDLKTPKFHDDR